MESKVIWIDENIDNEENTTYIDDLESSFSVKITPCKNVYTAINKLKEIKFIETKVIISGKLYNEFVRMFKDSITTIFVAPKIIVFTKDKTKFLENHRNFENNDNIFYNHCGVADSLIEIIKFLKNEIVSNKINIADNARLTFEYIESKEQLVLPLFFKTLIEKSSNKEMKEYTLSLYNTYSKKSDNIKNLLGSIKSIPNIPVEILSKYYARLYTFESDFFKDINEELGENVREKYLPFIKTLYEGVKYQSLPLSEEKLLYRGSKIANSEIEKIKENMKKKIEGLPNTIAFSKSFLSFSKEKKQAEKFYKSGKINQGLSRVLFVLEKDDEIGYNLATHGDLRDVSFFPDEQEVLFFPFSSFEIKDIKEIQIENEAGYEIKLLYLGKYLKDIENDKTLIKNANKVIFESKFKDQLFETGLIKEENIEKINTQAIYRSFKKYEKEIKEINEKKEIKVVNESYDNQKNEIVGEIDINIYNVNSKIPIINSFEKVKRKNRYEDKSDDLKYKNEKEIKEHTEIKINGKSIPFSYYYIFRKEGKYKIKYIFNKQLTKSNHMFFGSEFLQALDLSGFDTKNINNMSCMFYNCKMLKNINLLNFDQNVENMSYMFAFCNSLKNLDLSSFNTQYVTDMNNMFIDCNNLMYLDLSNFNTDNVVNMSYMFRGNTSLKYLDLSNFNTRKVKAITDIFFNCNLKYDKNVCTNDYKIINELPINYVIKKI